jgi:predicted O-methyltransferase YrrM
MIFSKQSILDLFQRQWPRVNQADIKIIMGDTGGISAFECILMYLLILDNAPRWTIEFSPNHGFSTQAMAMALRVLGIKNRFGTFELKPNLCVSTTERMKKLGLLNYVDVVQGNALQTIPEWIKQKNAKVDLVFVDSDHTEKFANRYIKELFPLFQRDCLLGVHDICSHKRDDGGQTAFKTSLGSGSKCAGEEKPIERHLKGKKFCVLHAITGGKHESANLPVNNKLYEELQQITGFDFRKAIAKPCPKSVWFLNDSIPRPKTPLPTFAPPPVVQNQYLFIVGMNDSGTTFVQNALSHCANCVSFKHPKRRPNGMEGQGVSFWKKKNKGWYPRDIDHGVPKVFSEKVDLWRKAEKWNWKEIKAAWSEAWKQNDHFQNANPKIFLEKTPSSLFSLDAYLQHFPDAKFIFIHRNPYVTCEGIRRTVKKYKKLNYSLTRCAKHWLICAQQQFDNIKRFCPERGIFVKYEELVSKPDRATNRIKNFIPAFHDLDLRKPTMCHGMDGNKVQAVTNYNNRQLKNLTPKDYAEINEVLRGHEELMRFYKYAYRDQAP